MSATASTNPLRITDLSIPSSSLEQNERVFRDYYLIASIKIWGINPSDLRNNLPPDEIKEIYNEWKLSCNQTDQVDINHVILLIERIKSSTQFSDPSDSLITQIWKKLKDVFRLQAANKDIFQETYGKILDLSFIKIEQIHPIIVYDNNQKHYQGGQLPVGLLYHAPYPESPRAFDRAEHEKNTLWLHCRIMRTYLTCSGKTDEMMKLKLDLAVDRIYRWVFGEELIWNSIEGNHHYSAFIGDPPKEITNYVASKDELRSYGYRVFVTAHRLPNGAEVLSVALLPEKMDSETRVHIHIPDRFGKYDLPTPGELLQQAKDLRSTDEAHILYGRRLLPETTDFRPSEPKYRDNVNPSTEAFQIYDNLLTTDISEFVPEVLKTYGELKETVLQHSILWGKRFGTNRLIADLAKDPTNCSPFVLVIPLENLSPSNPHWSTLDSYMGIEENSDFNRESLAKATDILENASRLPEIPGRKVMIVRAPTNLNWYPRAPNHDQLCDQLKEILESKGYDVHLLSPEYISQEEPIYGFRVFPRFGEPDIGFLKK